MSTYLLFALAMCGIVMLSLIATGYLAAKFNRAAKRDLEAALAPLAALLEGEVDVDEARASGRYAGHLASGQVARAPNGLGREFRVELVDAAGGTDWVISEALHQEEVGAESEKRFNVDPRIAKIFAANAENLSLPGSDQGQRTFRLGYLAEAGTIRLSWPMRSRRDIPEAGRFQACLDVLVAIGPVNRVVQGATDAHWVGGRSPSRRSAPAGPPA
ncbi:MAG TPA: hypothetical protein VGR16_02305 [Thermomicrobiales bacterium]|nr:hypothetical protein [Thermomicrobiales bacterium]